MPPAAGVLVLASGEHPHPLPPLQTEGRNLEDLRWLFKEKVSLLKHQSRTNFDAAYQYEYPTPAATTLRGL